MATKRTTLLLDTELVAKAAEVLGTSKPTDTVRASLGQTVRQARLQNLVSWELPDTAYEELKQQREHRRGGS